MPLREEQLAPRKQTIEAGRVSVGTEVVEEEHALQVPVTREEVIIERQPVDRQPSDEPLRLVWWSNWTRRSGTNST